MNNLLKSIFLSYLAFDLTFLWISLSLSFMTFIDSIYHFNFFIIIFMLMFGIFTLVFKKQNSGIYKNLYEPQNIMEQLNFVAFTIILYIIIMIINIPIMSWYLSYNSFFSRNGLYVFVGSILGIELAFIKKILNFNFNIMSFFVSFFLIPIYYILIPYKENLFYFATIYLFAIFVITFIRKYEQ
ncbi:MAG: hypothetical protein QMC67_08535 [Candidatus Wallbacteria bacterium]|mgnify:CR=1 FL=1